MTRVHFLNVSPGDCSIIEHDSGHVSVIDICDGNIDEKVVGLRRILSEALPEVAPASGNFGMSNYPTNPIGYLQRLGVSSLFRFILTHADMDHMDGLDALAANFSIGNFWHTGANRSKPSFGEGSPYREEDWDRYARLASGLTLGTTTISNLAGSRFAAANRSADGTGIGDGLFVVAPDRGLVEAAEISGDFNDASYVIVYVTRGGRIVFSGDAHDDTWDYVLANHSDLVTGCAVLIAPHHGRGSGRKYDFLDQIKPTLTLFGSAPSEYLDYGAWNSRDLMFVTSNQAGNIVLEVGVNRIDVCIENSRFVVAQGLDVDLTNQLGYPYLMWVRDNPLTTAI